MSDVAGFRCPDPQCGAPYHARRSRANHVVGCSYELLHGNRVKLESVHRAPGKGGGLVHRYTAACACGWVGHTYQTDRLADNDYLRHLVAAGAAIVATSSMTGDVRIIPIQSKMRP